MRISYRAGIVAAFAGALVVGCVGFAAGAATKTSSYRACATSSGALGLLKSGKCAKGSHPVSIGAAGALPKTLPSGATETGTFAISSAGGTTNVALDALSFTIPLASALNAAHAPEIAQGKNADPKHCAGSVSRPTAAPGYFCAYLGASKNLAFVLPFSTASKAGTARTGTAVLANPLDFSSDLYAIGSWAVTAP